MKKKLIRFLVLAISATLIFACSFLPIGSGQIWLRVTGVLLILFGAASLFFRDTAAEPVRPEYRYETKSSLMTPPERELYRLLLLSASDFAVFPQVALVSLVDKTTQNAFRSELFRVVDFALCDRKTYKPLLVIELNDASHRRADRALRDEKVKCILDRAGLRLLVIETTEPLDEKSLRRRIVSALK